MFYTLLRLSPFGNKTQQEKKKSFEKIFVITPALVFIYRAGVLISRWVLSFFVKPKPSEEEKREREFIISAP